MSNPISDQEDIQARVQEIERDCAALESNLKAAGREIPQRPTPTHAEDIIEKADLLEAHRARLQTLAAIPQPAESQAAAPNGKRQSLDQRVAARKAGQPPATGPKEPRPGSLDAKVRDAKTAPKAEASPLVAILTDLREHRITMSAAIKKAKALNK